MTTSATTSEKAQSVPVKTDFPIWKTIKLGTGLRSADDFREAIKGTDMFIGDWGNDILGKPEFIASDTETEVNLVLVSNIYLGFENGAKQKDTFARAQELGLQLCPNEVGPQLLLQHKDQPKEEMILIGMKTNLASDNRLCVNCCDDGTQWLFGLGDDPDAFWEGNKLFVFIKPSR